MLCSLHCKFGLHGNINICKKSFISLLFHHTSEEDYRTLLYTYKDIHLLKLKCIFAFLQVFMNIIHAQQCVKCILISDNFRYFPVRIRSISANINAIYISQIMLSMPSPLFPCQTNQHYTAKPKLLYSSN